VTTIKRGTRTLSFQSPHEADGTDIKTDKSTNGSSVRDWRNRMRLGQDCSTNYTREETFVERLQGGSWRAKWRQRRNSLDDWTQYVGSAWGFPCDETIVGVEVPVNADNAAKAAFVSKMDATRKSLSSITVLGEIGQTINQIRHPFASIQKAISSHISLVEKRGLREYKFLKRRPRARKRIARDLAQKELKDDVAIRNLALRKAATGSYLELVFGIQPTIADVQSAIEGAHRLSERACDMQRISAASNFEVNLPKVTVGTNGRFNLAGVGPDGPVRVGHVQISRVVKLIGKVRYSGAIALHTNRVSPLREEFGFMPRDFLPDVWNFLPWSWLVDYAFDVGSVLQSLTASYSDLKWVNKAVKYEQVQTLESIDPPIDDVFETANIVPMGIACASPSRVVIRKLSYARETISPSIGSFMPQFSLKMPSMKQLLNLGAVLHQQVSVSRKFHAKRSGPEFSRLDDLHLIR